MLKRLLGDIYFEIIEGIKWKYILIFAAILSLFIGLSCIWHVGFIANILSILCSSFVITVFVVIIITKIEKDEYDYEIDEHSCQYEKRKVGIRKKSATIFNISLYILGIILIILACKYRKQYSFDCLPVVLDNTTMEYHLFDDCKYLKSKSEECNVYTAKHMGFTMCTACKEYYEYVMDDYNANRYTRR